MDPSLELSTENGIFDVGEALVGDTITNELHVSLLHIMIFKYRPQIIVENSFQNEFEIMS